MTPFTFCKLKHSSLLRTAIFHPPSGCFLCARSALSAGNAFAVKSASGVGNAFPARRHQPLRQTNACEKNTHTTWLPVGASGSFFVSTVSSSKKTLHDQSTSRAFKIIWVCTSKSKKPISSCFSLIWIDEKIFALSFLWFLSVRLVIVINFLGPCGLHVLGIIRMTTRQFCSVACSSRGGWENCQEIKSVNLCFANYQTCTMDVLS